MGSILTAPGWFTQTDRHACQIEEAVDVETAVARLRTDAAGPVVGATFAYIRDPLRMMRRAVRRLRAGLGDRLRRRALDGPARARRLRRGLQNKDKAFANGPGWGELVGPFFDRGLMLLDFEEHHRHRRMMQQAFTRAAAGELHRGAGPGDRRRARRLGAGRRTSGSTRP